MEKIGFQTFSAYHFNQSLNFKANAILFDKLFIHSSFFDAVLNSELVQATIKLDQPNLIKDNYRQIEYLIEKGILSVYRPTKKFSLDEIDSELKNELNEFFKLDELLRNIGNKTDIPFEQYLEINNLYFDYVTRFSCKELKLRGYNDIYPLLASKKSFSNRSNKQEVLSFILNKLPQPSPDTSWEQVIEFKSDSDSKSKYLALIQWINKTASTKRPINEVEDEYEYLYNQYTRHFALHKMKTDLTTWEMIVAAGIDTLTSMQGIPTFFKNLFSISKTRISLLEDEMKLPGQEIAYIHKASETFPSYP